jgi:hypothetical protein
MEAMPNAGKPLTSCSECYSGSTYTHLSATGSWESVYSIEYSGAFDGPLALGGGLALQTEAGQATPEAGKPLRATDQGV